MRVTRSKLEAMAGVCASALRFGNVKKARELLEKVQPYVCMCVWACTSVRVPFFSPVHVRVCVCACGIGVQPFVLLCGYVRTFCLRVMHVTRCYALHVGFVRLLCVSTLCVFCFPLMCVPARRPGVVSSDRACAARGAALCVGWGVLVSRSALQGCPPDSIVDHAPLMVHAVLGRCALDAVKVLLKYGASVQVRRVSPLPFPRPPPLPPPVLLPPT
jgi:hypothetical protein